MALRDVELVEDEPERAVVADDEPPARSWLRRHPAVVAAIVVVLALAAGTAVVLDLRARAHEAARAEALRTVPGVLREVDPDLPVAVSSSRSWASGEAPPPALQAELYAAVAGDVAVVGSTGGPGGEATVAVVVGVDVRTGEERWRTPVEPPPGDDLEGTASVWCAGPDDDPAIGLPLPAAAGTPVGCTVQWYRAAAPGDQYLRHVVAALELDPVDGRLLHRLDLADRSTVARTADGWVVASTHDDAPTVERLAGDGTPRWRAALAPSSTDSPWSDLTVRDGRVLLTQERDASLLDLEDGTVLAEHRDVATTAAALLPGGAVVLGGTPGGSRRGGVLHPPDGPAVPLGAESVVPVTVDDGSLGAVLLTSSGVAGRGAVDRDGEDDDPRTTLRGVDGRVLWRATGVGASTALVVDDTVVLLSPTHLAVVDGHDGDVRWRVALPRRYLDAQLLTDGAVLLVGAGRALDAWTFDGTPAWSAHVRAHGDEVELRGGEPAPTPTPGVGGASEEYVWWMRTLRGRLAVSVSSPATEREHVLVVAPRGAG